ncbi:MAG: isochorismate synthase [Leeuwenhoekiella sp.]|nr:isochorismate synthase [Leeuwenhoekiella sp.]MBA79784.1 isochorismate synthase [Leeuwenhoekiella sp.]
MLFKKLQEDFLQKKPFVAYCKPASTSIHYLEQQDDHLHFTTDFTESGFVFAPFEASEKAVLIQGKPEIIAIEHLNIEWPVEPLDLSISESQKQHHLELVERAVKYIKESSLQKVVLSRKQTARILATSPVVLFKRLLNKYPEAFVYLWHHPQVGTWLGATPETLLSLNGYKFETMALAGTQKYEGNMEVNWGLKEQEEQELVTRDLITRLNTFDLKKLVIQDRETYKAGSLLHLRTCITGSFNRGSLNLSKLIRALHPTPAVCGLPRAEAQSFIKNNEGYQRGFYTGFLGELNILEDQSKKRSRRNVENLAYKTLTPVTCLYVNLRCMKYKAAESEIYVGGGITKDSVPGDEWQETVNKAQTIASIL